MEVYMYVDTYIHSIGIGDTCLKNDRYDRKLCKMFAHKWNYSLYVYAVLELEPRVYCIM